MELWVWITIGAAFCQNLRSALQRYLTDRLSAEGSTSVRFVYSIPFVIAYVVLLHHIGGMPLPQPNARFLLYGFVGGTTQILATVFLIRSFALGNFAVGTALSKTETIQAAVFGAVILGETVSTAGLIGIIVSLVGVLVLATPKRTADGARPSFFSRGALLGLASGALFAIAIVTFRGAALALTGHNFAMQAAYAQLWITIFQALVMIGYLLMRDRGQLARIARAWRPAVLVGASGMLGSAGWFAATALQQAAYVRAVGQIELVFTFIVSLVWFRERIKALDGIGVLLIVAGIVFLLLG